METPSSVPRETSATVSDIRRDVADLSDWLTKQQAADAIGVSTKAIERWAQARKLEQRSRPQARGPNVAVYNPDDVARLASERHPAPAPFVLPAGTDAAPANANGVATKLHQRNADSALTPRRLLDSNDPLQAFAAAVYAAVMSQTSETSANSQPLFLTLAEASALSGLSQAYLRRLIDEQKLPAVRDRGWRIRRRDLEQL